MKYKGVEDGTKSGETLCKTCSHSLKMRGRAEGQERSFCLASFEISIVLDWEPIECSSYHETGKPTVHDFSKIAWVISVDEPKNKMGFIKPGTAEHRKLINDL